MIKNAICLQVKPAPVLCVDCVGDGCKSDNDQRSWDFGTTRPGKDVTTDIMYVRNGGSGLMTVSDIQTFDADADTVVDDTIVPAVDKSFTLVPGTERNISITIHTDNIPSGTWISREIRVISDGRIADMTPPSDRIVITGLVSDELPIFQVPGVTQGQCPDISGSWIVWEDRRNGNADIYAYDISTGTEQQITKDARDQVLPRISGNLIAWVDYRNWDGTAGSADIYWYDLNTHEEFVIPRDSAQEYLIGLDRNNVAFVRHEFLFDFYGGIAQRKGYNLYYYDTNTGDTHQVTAYSTEPGSPVHSVNSQGDFADGVIASLDNAYNWDSAHSTWNSGYLTRIMKYEIAVDSAPVFTDERLAFQRGPATSGGRIVWTEENDSEAYQVWIWDGFVHKVTDEETDHGENALAVGRDFIVYDKHSASGLFYWDLNENREFLLTQRLSRSEAARMDANFVVWHSWVDSECRIYYASLDGKLPCPQLINPGTLSPANGSSGPRQITFEWAAVSNTAGYAFQIDTVDVDFNHLWCYEVVSGNQVTKTIAPVDSIYWRVKALGSGACSDGPWTSPLVYVFSELWPEPPSNLQAFDSPEDQGHSVTLTWTKSPDDGAGLNIVSYYRIYRSQSSEFTDPIPISSFPWSVCPDTLEFSPGFCPALDSLMAMELTHTIFIDSVVAGTTEYVDAFVPVNGVPYYYWLDAVAANGAISAKVVAQILPTGANEETAVSLPQKYLLYQNSPNPFNASTRIRYELPQLSAVRLVVYDIIGRRVRTVLEGFRPAGYHSVLWDGKDQEGRPVGSGVYLYQLEVGEFVKTRRMLLLK